MWVGRAIRKLDNEAFFGIEFLRLSEVSCCGMLCDDWNSLTFGIYCIVGRIVWEENYRQFVISNRMCIL